jgi:hypothetical protein
MGGNRANAGPDDGILLGFVRLFGRVSSLGNSNARF